MKVGSRLTVVRIEDGLATVVDNEGARYWIDLDPIQDELYGQHCPDESCPGVIDKIGCCSHCGTNYEEQETT